MSSTLLNATILWIHLLSAVLLVGGSFFMWLVVIPASRKIFEDETARMRMVEKTARRFGALTNATLVVLVLTGIYNASWYLPGTKALFDTLPGNVLLAKIVLVAALVVLVYVHGFYFGRKIVRLAKEGRSEELDAVRKLSRVVSAVNLVLMVGILLLAVFLQVLP